jgi:hypothetical protein
MRYFTSQIFSTACLTATLWQLPGAVLAQLSNSWVRINTDEYDNVAYVDRASVKGSAKFRYFWTYVTAGAPYPDQESGKQIYGTSAYVSADCKNKRYRLRTVRLYDQNNQIVKEFAYGDRGAEGFATFHPAALASVNFACSRQLPPPKPPAPKSKTQK